MSMTINKLLGVRINARDLAALRVLVEQGCCRSDDLAPLLGHLGGDLPITDRAARYVLARWRTAGLVGISRILSGPAVVFPTGIAGRLTGWPNVVRAPALAYLRHDLTATAVRLRYEADGWNWIAERVLHLRDNQPGHRPDGLAIGANATRVAVEVELTPKSVTRLQQILASSLASYDEIHYWGSVQALAAVSKAMPSAVTPADARRIRLTELPAELVR